MTHMRYAHTQPRRILSAARLLICVLVSACASNAVQAPTPRPAKFTIRLDHVPAYTPAGVSIYVAGTFNGWNPGDPTYRLVQSGTGQYTVDLCDSLRGPIEFKFTLGSWEVVETDSAGRDVNNRSTVIGNDGRIYVGRVAGWRDPKTARVREHTARPTVSVLNDSFPIPQLGRARRIWIYLPPAYATSSERFPVLYMQDAQNVFDNATSFAGEWGVDETLDSLQALGDRGVIVVGVDHGGPRRIDEYSPWKNAKYGGGQGEQYIEFIAKTLKPYIDSHYRTLPARRNTGIAGSSLGAVISLYAILKYPDVFGRAAMFSPSLWFAPAIHSYVREAGPLAPDLRLYFVSGALEGSSSEESGVYVAEERRMIDELVAAGLKRDVNVISIILADGKHSEWFWRREFPAAYQWLFGQVDYYKH